MMLFIIIYYLIVNVISFHAHVFFLTLFYLSRCLFQLVKYVTCSFKRVPNLQNKHFIDKYIQRWWGAVWAVFTLLQIQQPQPLFYNFNNFYRYLALKY